MEPFSLAVDIPAAQQNQTQAQHLSKWVTSSELDYEEGKKKKKPQQENYTFVLHVCGSYLLRRSSATAALQLNK